jgi:elongation factor 1 alpha-like protein
VVLGPVDAGKSTLMGRLLHELGAVSSKEVHKHQREAAQMGKVRAPCMSVCVCGGQV